MGNGRGCNSKNNSSKFHEWTALYTELRSRKFIILEAPIIREISVIINYCRPWSVQCMCFLFCNRIGALPKNGVERVLNKTRDPRTQVLTRGQHALSVDPCSNLIYLPLPEPF